MKLIKKRAEKEVGKAQKAAEQKTKKTGKETKKTQKKAGKKVAPLSGFINNMIGDRAKAVYAPYGVEMAVVKSIKVLLNIFTLFKLPYRIP